MTNDSSQDKPSPQEDRPPQGISRREFESLRLSLDEARAEIKALKEKERNVTNDEDEDEEDEDDL